MNSQPITIRNIKREELPLIRDFAPIEWNSNLENIYNRHFEKKEFYPIVAIINKEIAGTGIAIVHDGISWLGTIIVKEKYRNQGLGRLITSKLIEYSNSQGTNCILLVASDMGYPVYQKLGFQLDSNYLFFKTDVTPSFNLSKIHISPIKKSDSEEIYHLDSEITKENRKELLFDCLETGYKYFDNKITGYYLPEFGKGLIVALNAQAGIELMKLKIMQEKTMVCIPETNLAAIDFLHSSGYYEYMRSPRMFLGENIEWKSKCIFSRGSGYIG
jgi:GNAT superfamily N-acetyltransferase